MIRRLPVRLGMVEFKLKRALTCAKAYSQWPVAPQGGAMPILDG